MAENSVSDVDPDDLAEMMKGIDDLDDDLFGKKPKSALPPKETTPQRSVLKSSQQESSQGLKSGQQEGSQQGSGGRKVQFSPKTESDWDTNDVDPGEEKEKVTNQNEPFKDPPVRDILRKKVEIDFGEDDILGGLDSNTSKSKSKPSSGLLDDIFGKPADKNTRLQLISLPDCEGMLKKWDFGCQEMYSPYFCSQFKKDNFKFVNKLLKIHYQTQIQCIQK